MSAPSSDYMHVDQDDTLRGHMRWLDAAAVTSMSQCSVLLTTACFSAHFRKLGHTACDRSPAQLARSVACYVHAGNHDQGLRTSLYASLRLHQF